MSELTKVSGTELRKILETMAKGKVPGIMSYLSKDKWHATKVFVSNLADNLLELDVLPRKKPQPLNVQPDQQVGLSIKHGYGKFVFGTEVVGLKASADPAGNGVIMLSVPKHIGLVQKRSYFRVQVPESLTICAELSARHNARGSSEQSDKQWQCVILDISAGGIQVAADLSQRSDFREGQYVQVRFEPLPNEEPLVFSAQIRNVYPTADGKSICIGMQIVGLETSHQGRMVLERLCGVVEQYYQMNQCGARQRESKPLQY